MKHWGMTITLVALAAIAIAAQEGIADSVGKLLSELLTLAELFSEAAAHAAHCAAADAATRKGLFQNLVGNLNFSRVWLPLTTLSALLASSKLVVDFLEEASSGQRRNEFRSTVYSNIGVLLVMETISFVSNGPNALSLAVGVVQCVAAGKKAIIYVNVFTYLQQIYRSVRQHVRSARSDESRNGVQVLLAKGAGMIRLDKVKVGDVVELGFCDQTPAFVEVESCTPCRARTDGEGARRAPKCPDAGRGPASAYYGYVYDRDRSGEDISKDFKQGDKLQPFLELTRPFARVTARVVGLVKPERGLQLKPPDFLDLPLLVVNFAAMGLVLLLAVSLAASATVGKVGGLPQGGDVGEVRASMAELTKEFFLHVAAGAVAEHSIIPSMRMSLLYTIFLVVLGAGFWQVTVQQYSAFSEIQRLDCVTFDKTGTLTDHEVMRAHEWYPLETAQYPCAQTQEAFEQLGWTQEELWVALTLANSESSVLEGEQLSILRAAHKARGVRAGCDDDGVWGTSPEECEMLRWWLKGGTQLEANPLRGECAAEGHTPLDFVEPAAPGVVRFWRGPAGTEVRRMLVLQRSHYRFEVGKLATVQLLGAGSAPGRSLRLEVRQTGMSFLCGDEVQPGAAELIRRVAAGDPRRAMGLAFRDADQREQRWTLAGVFTFENPVRPGVRRTIEFLRGRGVSVGMLTGDAREAAEAIARQTGIFPQGQELLHLEQDADGCMVLGARRGEGHGLPQEQGAGGEPRDPWEGHAPQAALEALLSDRKEERTVAVEGRLIQKWASSADSRNQEDLRRFLTHPKINRVMYRACETVKRDATLSARKSAVVMHVGDAANDALALGASSLGACLRHGAEVSRGHSKLLITTPQDLVDVMAPNGLADMMVVGSQRLLCDLCLLSGTAAGLIAVGLHSLRFELLASGQTGERLPIFVDAWPQSHWVVFSNLYYVSAMANATAECTAALRMRSPAVATKGCLLLVKGLAIGGLGGWVIKNWSSAESYGFVALHLLVFAMLTKHSWHCYWRHAHQDKEAADDQRVVVGFGPQHRSRHTTNTVCRALSMIDTVMFRIVAYWLFCVFTFHVDQAPKTREGLALQGFLPQEDCA